MQTSVIQRVKELISKRGVTPRGFASEIDFNYSTLNNYLSGRRTTIDSSLPEAILRTFGNISADWLMTGKGSMLKMDPPGSDGPKSGIPYYEELPVSAGRLDVITQNAQPSGWVNLPGVTAAALFPVVGCSMKPDINPGDVIGITLLDAWDIVDPDKVYLVITNDERMIKHLAIDETDDSVIWCISPNYPKFKINKSDIKYIYRVSFCGKLI